MTFLHVAHVRPQVENLWSTSAAVAPLSLFSPACHQRDHLPPPPPAVFTVASDTLTAPHRSESPGSVCSGETQPAAQDEHSLN